MKCVSLEETSPAPEHGQNRCSRFCSGTSSITSAVATQACGAREYSNVHSCGHLTEITQQWAAQVQDLNRSPAVPSRGGLSNYREMFGIGCTGANVPNKHAIPFPPPPPPLARWLPGRAGGEGGGPAAAACFTMTKPPLSDTVRQ